MSLTEYEQYRIAEWGWMNPRSVIQSVASPAAGAGFTIPTSGAVEQTLRSLSFRLVTDGNAASRIVVFQFLDPDGTAFGQCAAPFTLAASKTCDFTCAVGIQEFGANDAANIGVPIPEIKLDQTLSVAVTITGVQVGDQVSRIRAAWDRWPVRPPLQIG